MPTRNPKIEKIIREKSKGRPPGAGNINKRLLRELIEEYTDGNFHTFTEKMNEIDKPEVYAKLFLELLAFRMPKLKSVDFKGDVRNSSLEEKLKALHLSTLSEIEDEGTEEEL